MTDRNVSPDLGEADRQLLAGILQHGLRSGPEPHPDNLLATTDGP